MKPEQQRIAISEACGYIWNEGRPGISGWWCDPNGFQVSWGNIKSEALNQIYATDYLNDLNAMHEAWKTLTGEQKARYRTEIALIGAREMPNRDECWIEDICAEFGHEAFLRTINKWEDEE